MQPAYHLPRWSVSANRRKAQKRSLTGACRFTAIWAASLVIHSSVTMAVCYSWFPIKPTELMTASSAADQTQHRCRVECSLGSQVYDGESLCIKRGKVSVRTYVRSSVALGVASSVANDVIMRMTR